MLNKLKMKKIEISQKQIFLNGEGDNWYLRNKKKINNKLKNKIVTSVLNNHLNKSYKRKINFLEIGCSNGSLLLNIKKKKNFNIFGVDPSKKAINELKNKGVNSHVGTADKIFFKNKSMDVIFYGFCLYLCDQKDYLKIVKSADRILRAKGKIVILDFYSKKIKKNSYKHDERIKCIKRDFSKIFTVKKFKLVYQKLFNYSYMFKVNKYIKDDRIAISVLERNKNV